MNSHRTTLITATVLSMMCLKCAVFGDDPSGTTRQDIARELDEVARIAGVMIDGDACEKIMTERALNFLFTVDPRDPWAASDNFDVNHEPYIRTKKTLIRLSRLVPYPCDLNLWMPVKGKPGKIQVLIRNANEWSQFWTWGMLTQDTPPEMDRVLRTGKRETVRLKPGMVSVLAPVTNSLGDTVGLVEVVAYPPDFAAPQVHARVVTGEVDVHFVHVVHLVHQPHAPRDSVTRPHDQRVR